MNKLALVIATASIFSLATSRSNAATPEAPEAEPARGKVAIAGLVGQGIGFSHADEGPYRLGFGVRAGITLPQRVYLGGTFVYHGGTSRDGASGNVFYLGGEAGYDFGTGPVVVRPYIGLGILSARASVSRLGYSASDSKSYLYVAPGVAVHFLLGERWFIGGDARVLTVPSEDSDSWNVSFLATFGATL
jgi:hypothetical protein